MVSLVSPQTQLDSLPPGVLPPYFLLWFITGLSILHHIHCLAAATWFPLVVGRHKLFLIGLQHISIQFTHIYMAWFTIVFTGDLPPGGFLPYLSWYPDAGRHISYVFFW